MDGRSNAVKVPWTPDEDEIIKKGTHTLDELCELIPRHTKSAIRNRQSQLKPKEERRSRRTWTEKEVALISDMSLSNKKVAEMIGVKPFDIQQSRYARFGWAPKRDVFEDIDHHTRKILMNPELNNTQAAKLCNMSPGRVKKFRTQHAPNINFKRY